MDKRPQDTIIQMGRFKVSYPLVALCTVLALIVEMEGQVWPPPLPRPLCSSQFALASYACARLPYNPNPIVIPPPPLLEAEAKAEHEHEHRHRHGHEHEQEHRHQQEHEHHRRHRSHHQVAHSAAEEECCRWARQVDSQCVCEALVHLATFLVRPSHAITIAITEDCVVSYSCNGRIRI